MEDHTPPPLEFDGEPSEEELTRARNTALSTQLAIWEARCIAEFGEIEGTEQDIMDRKRLLKSLIADCYEQIQLLNNRIERYEWELDCLNDVHPDYARDRAEYELDLLCNPEYQERPGSAGPPSPGETEDAG